MLLLFQIFLMHLLACELSENDPITSLNPGCNYAGICVSQFGRHSCFCCNPETQGGSNCGEHWTCNPEKPLEGCVKFKGATCSETIEYSFVVVGFRLDTYTDSPPDMKCYTNSYDRATSGKWNVSSFDMVAQVQKVATDRGWPGTIYSNPKCDTCSSDYPCTYGVASSVNAVSGSTHGFQVDLMHYYNLSCSIVNGSGVVSDTPCEANYDFGQSAYYTWQNVRGPIHNDDTQFIQALNELLHAPPDSSNGELGLNWTNSYVVGMTDSSPLNTLNNVWITSLPTPSPTHPPTRKPTDYPTALPTIFPTGSPTKLPTQSPTSVPNVCERYVNQVEDLVFEGVGSNCRAGLNESWPGGLTCDSPYIVCLPLENTNGEFGGEAYKSATHRYSVDECLQECANDQRCMGVEFVADSSSALGDCNLIDDIPLEIGSMVDGFTYNPEERYSNLDSNVTNGSSMCFVKQEACNPQFEAIDLSEDMLNCYCPNNRKGSYTKKVKRTVDNTRFCGDDSEVEVRIRKAQANRMFHLCENWCLFHTDDPKAESWYWDPWKACWREQYDGSYCSRVIINPVTIEMQFVTHRSNRSTICPSD